MTSDRTRILIVDDEPNIRKLVAGVLEDEGLESAGAADIEETRRLLERESFDLILLDVNLPGTDGLAFLKSEAGKQTLPPVIIMSGHGSIPVAIEATRLGALDFIEKPVTAERLLVSIRNGLRMRRLQDENRRLRGASGRDQAIIGSSAAVGRLREEIDRAAPTDARVLITGKNGTGKELVARALHAGSPRRDRAFIKVNCAAIPSELLESELFGHVKGAFTGAVATRKGKFELAQKGTLLLDEIGDMNAATQAKLLRVLEENEMERVGGEQTISLDVRVLASTNQDLPRRIEEGRFREDLYYRLKVIPIRVPALREHASDIPELLRYYLDHYCQANGRPPLELSDDTLSILERYRWPGNIRELKNMMERLAIMVDSTEIRPDHVLPLVAGEERTGQAAGLPTAEETRLSETIEAYERDLIVASLERAGGNIAEAARRLGLDRANLHRKMKRLGIERPPGS